MFVLRLPRRTLRLLTLGISFLLLLAVAVAMGGGFNRTVSAVAELVAMKPIYAVETEQKQIAISFDASWGASHTEELLDILDQNEVKTTFFLVNLWMEEYPELTREIKKRGHEIALHSASHPSFTTLSEQQMRDELTANRAMIEELTATTPTLFRPPFGDYDDRVIATVQELGYTVIQWSVDSLDWQGLTAQEIITRVTDGVGNGAIVLFHNDGAHTAEALTVLLPQLLQEGYEIVPVSALIYKDNYYIDYNGIQKRQG